MTIEYQDANHDEEFGSLLYIEGDDVDGVKFDNVTYVSDFSGESEAYGYLFAGIDYFIRDGKVLEPEQVNELIREAFSLKEDQISKEDFEYSVYRLIFPTKRYPNGRRLDIAKPSIENEVEKQLPGFDELDRSDCQPEPFYILKSTRKKIAEKEDELKELKDEEKILSTAKAFPSFIDHYSPYTC